MAIEIVDLPINSMVIFHSYVNVYQRVSLDSLLRHVTTDFRCARLSEATELLRSGGHFEAAGSTGIRSTKNYADFMGTGDKVYPLVKIAIENGHL